MFDCFDEEESCWWSCWCPCLVFSRTYHSMDISPTRTTMGIFFIVLLMWAISAMAWIGAAILTITVGGVALIYYRAMLRGELRHRLGIPGDFCSDFSAHCCCWPCVIAQEARQVKQYGRPYRDYGTGESLEEGAIIPPDPREASLYQHCKTLSRCSRILLFSFLSGVITVAALLGQKQGVSIYIMALIVPLIILYLLYWRRHRHSLPLDSAIKFFFAGFVVAVASAGVIEFMLSLLDFVILSPVEYSLYSHGESKLTFVSNNPVKVIFLDLITSYVIAACVEEFTKHMVVRGCWLPHPLRSPRSVTIAFVAGALGFATCENLFYVFSAKSGEGLSKYETELITLLLRSILPVHPICAAIQSVGVIKRDFENDSSQNLFKILLPAIIVHGTYDFSQMLLGDLLPAFTNFNALQATAAIIGAALGMTCISIGYMMYLFNNQRQRLRAGWERVSQSQSSRSHPADNQSGPQLSDSLADDNYINDTYVGERLTQPLREGLVGTGVN
ncbi:hypothetical protein AAMO2058_001509100 [Amorphochlora amoebiformis]